MWNKKSISCSNDLDNKPQNQRNSLRLTEESCDQVW